MTRLSVIRQPSVFWDEGTVVPDGTRRSGERLEVPADGNARRRWQRAAEVYVTEVADAVAERDAARVGPKPRIWWTPRRRRRAAGDVIRRADSRFTERVDAAASAYRPHGDGIQALLDAQREAVCAETEARLRRVYEAFSAWHTRHNGRRTLADAAQWQWQWQWTVRARRRPRRRIRRLHARRDRARPGPVDVARPRRHRDRDR
jgi:hypothetical protein